jgi:hypothetical protein
LRDTTFLLGGISNSLEPRMTSSLPAVCAQTIDRNIGQPLRNLLSYRCSTTLAFKVFGVLFENFEQKSVKQCQRELKSATSCRAVLPCAPPCGAATALASRSPTTAHASPGHTQPKHLPWNSRSRRVLRPLRPRRAPSTPPAGNVARAPRSVTPLSPHPLLRGEGVKPAPYSLAYKR